MARLPDDTIKRILADPRAQSEDLSVSLEEINSFGDRDSILRMFGSIAAYNRMLKERITFVNDTLTKAIPFTRENLYLITAFTGSGKSTAAANISYPLWKQGKKSLVVSNEESEQDVLYRIGCLECGLNFNDYKKGLMPIADQRRVITLFPEISKYIKVIDVNYKNGLTTKLEFIQNALTAVQSADYSCAMIDYYQLIKYSTVDRSRNAYDVLNDLRIWMGRYIKGSNIPIVLFAQLHSQSKRQGKDLDNKIKDCPAVMEPATVIIEMVPNFEKQATDFIIVKDRFGLSGRKITCGYHKGRFVEYTHEFQRDVVDQKIAEIRGEDAEVKSDVQL
jgi:hypothetical protein